jgi:hypothetical protein
MTRTDRTEDDVCDRPHYFAFKINELESSMWCTQNPCTLSERQNSSLVEGERDYSIRPTGKPTYIGLSCEIQSQTVDGTWSGLFRGSLDQCTDRIECINDDCDLQRRKQVRQGADVGGSFPSGLKQEL